MIHFDGQSSLSSLPLQRVCGQLNANDVRVHDVQHDDHDVSVHGYAHDYDLRVSVNDHDDGHDVDGRAHDYDGVHFQHLYVLDVHDDHCVVHSLFLNVLIH